MRLGDIVANRFRIEAVAGAGGMGVVYRATDLAAGGSVALKTLGAVGERDAARFAREAGVLAELSHPGIVRYVAHGFTSQHEHYIAMEWLDGETVHDRMLRGRLAIDEAIVMVRAVADAIAAAHRRDVVHRDLKPMNLFVPGRDLGRTKVLDFGIARHIHHAGVLTATGAVIGTPGYMAPEQVRGETAIGPAADVFALGCVLYRALTGVSAFGGDRSLAVFAKILVEEVDPPSRHQPAIPPALDALVLRMLAKSARDRFADGRAVADALARLIEVTHLGDVHPEATADGHAATDVAAAATRGDTASTRAAITGTEQRLVSVVMVGAGDADLAEQLAPIATAYGGRLDRIADGGYLVMFTNLEVVTDHASRAARCALALHDRAPRLPVVVASGRASLDRLVVGGVIDRAAELVAGIAPGQVIVDEATANLLDERFAVHTVRGRHKLVGMRGGDVPASQEPVRTLLGKATPIVGRDRELATLEALWAECTEDAVSRIVLVTAPPGGGKSRLRQELVRRVMQRDPEAELLLGRGDLLRAGSPFAMLADLIRRTAGVREGDPLEDQREALTARISRHVAASDAARVTHLLGELTGIAFPSDASEALRAARTEPLVRGDAMRRAWIDWLAAETAAHPVLLVLEDLHWGDRLVVELVDAALRELANAPLLVLALARPEVHDSFPKLWHARALQEIRLPQLTKKACGRLVRDLLGTDVASETIAQIVDRSAGNAFFLEELIRAVAEGHAELPDSVLSMLQLRLDALTPNARRALRAASIFGEVFWHGGVAKLIDGDPTAALAELVERELVAPAPESQLPGEREYDFRHDLVREAAFAMLDPEDRVLAHRHAAEWLVEHGFTDALALANHFTAGGAPEKAAEHYAHAAEQAISGNDLVSVYVHAERGLASSPTPEVAARLHIALAEAHNWQGEHAVALEMAQRARAELEVGSVGWFRATDEAFYAAGRKGDLKDAVAFVHDLTGTVPVPEAAAYQLRSVARAAIVMLRLGSPPVAAALFERAAQLAEPLTIDLATEQRLQSLFAMAARARGDAIACIEHHEAGQRACEASHNLRELAFNYLSYGGVVNELGDSVRGAELVRCGIDVAERVGASTITPLLHFSLAMCEHDLGHHEVARQHAEIAVALAADNDRPSAGLAHWMVGRASLAIGDLDRAERALATSLDLLGRYPQYRPIVLATAVHLQLRRGDVELARRLATEAMTAMRLGDGFEEGESLIRLSEIDALEAAGEHEAARAALATAIQRLETRAARIQEPWRSSYLAKTDNAELRRRASCAGA
ncbi:MAG TPA: protein kinase [Kofleriaceae bacterium]|nr:protein kinase [Kofleriaceae bacterium]